MCEVLYGCLRSIKTYDICLKTDPSYMCRTNKHEAKKMANNYQSEIQTKLTKSLLDMIILQFLDAQPMHGYQIITKIRKNFGVYFGPSTVYPLLGLLEKKGYVKSVWSMDGEKPRKVYTLTSDGQTVLSFTEGSLKMICRTLTADTSNKSGVELRALTNKK